MKCDICGGNATVHLTNVLATGIQSQHYYCEFHAPVSASPMDNQSLLTQVRRLISFMDTERRIPSSHEVKQLGWFSEEQFADRDPKKFAEQLRYLKEFVAFMERHGRAPDEDELHDPF